MKHTLFLISSILISTNAFGQWTRMNFTYGADPFVAIGENTSSPTIFVGNINGIYRSTDNGVSWMLASSQLANLQVDALAVTGGNTSSPTLLAGTYGHGIFRSTDSGVTWITADTGLAGIGTNAISDFTVAGTDASPMIFASTSYPGAGVFLSTDDGLHWNAVNSGLTTNSIYPLVSGSSNPAAPLLLAAGTANDTIYLSTNNGSDWSRISNGLPYSAIFSLAALDSNTSSPILFAGTWGDGVFRSSTMGASWDQENTGVTDLSIYSLASFGTNLFAGTDSGIFLSSDSGATWRSISQGLSPNNSYGYVVAVGSTLFAESDSVVDMFGDDTAFAWRRSISEMIGESGVSESQIAPAEIQLYPSPATNTLTIEGATGAISIFDPLGRNFTTLQPPPIPLLTIGGGVTIDISSLPAGIYFVSDGVSRTKFVKE